MMEFIKEHWHPLTEGLIGLTWIIVRLTPTQKDNNIFTVVVNILGVVFPNNRRGGGVH